jgi:hypothetical protein
MKSYLPLLVISAIFLYHGLAILNNPPISGYHPGYSYGTGPSGIEIEVVYDLLCSDTLDADPHFQAFLAMPFQGKTVKDQVKITYSFFPLPYHHEVWVVHKLLPFFEDQCRTAG